MKRVKSRIVVLSLFPTQLEIVMLVVKNGMELSCDIELMMVLFDNKGHCIADISSI